VSAGVRGDEHAAVADLKKTVIADLHVDGLTRKPGAHVIGEAGQADPAALPHSPRDLPCSPSSLMRTWLIGEHS
jgi:hypothetical protein